MANTALVWIRDDFRIQNNDALTYASNQHDIVTAVFIFNSSKGRNRGKTALSCINQITLRKLFRKVGQGWTVGHLQFASLIHQDLLIYI